MDQPRILVMAKAPVAGRVKTRLEPLLGPDGCARLQAELVRHTVAVAAGIAPVSVAVAGDLALVAPLVGDAPVFAQCDGSLGARMIAAVRAVPPASRGPRARESGCSTARVGAFDSASRGVRQRESGRSTGRARSRADESGSTFDHVGINVRADDARAPGSSRQASSTWDDGEVAGAVIVIGTDCPQLGAAHVRAALSLLAAGDDVVLGPAHDGGYYLIALAAATPPSAVFDLPENAWGGRDVLALSLAAAARAGLRAGTIGVEYDLDTPADAATALTDPRVPPTIAELLR